MLYLAIDQHSKQITVCIRDAAGDTIMSRQVSTQSAKIQAFFEQLIEMDPEFMAILEVCGFNDWLIAELLRWNCQEVVLIHPEKPSKKKTDRRDARKLADLLWLNRERLAAGQPVHAGDVRQAPDDRRERLPVAAPAIAPVTARCCSVPASAVTGSRGPSETPRR